MIFDKSKVYTALNADELKVGSKVICADTLEHLKRYVTEGRFIDKLTGIGSAAETYRFTTSQDYALAYLVEEPGNLKWTDLRIGDVITDGTKVSMVTEIDKKEDINCHICAGDGWWFDAKDLANWKKVED